MSASIDNDGCLVWPGKIGIITNGSYSKPEVNKLRVGRIAFQPHTNIFKIYTGIGRNEKPESSFGLTEVQNVAVYGMKDTVCIFRLIQQNGREKHYSVAIDFKGSRDPGNQLTPNEKAKSLCEFLLKLTNGGAKPSLLTTKFVSTKLPGSSHTSEPSMASAITKKRNVLISQPKQERNEDEKKRYQEELRKAALNIQSRSVPDTKIEVTTMEQPSPKTKVVTSPKKQQPISISSSSSRRRKNDAVEKAINPIKEEEIPTKRRKTAPAEKNPSIYESLRSRNQRSSGLNKLSNYSSRGSPSGLANMGNTCYMNSVLQATFIVDSFSKRLFEALKFFQKEALNSEVFIEKYLPLMKAFSNLLSNRCSGNSLTVFLKSVLGCVSTAADKFRNNRQEDAHEFLMDMLSQLQGEFNEAVKQLHGRRPYLLQSTDPIRECFGYTLRRIFSCQKCKHETSVEEENTNFIVHISDERKKSNKFTFADILRDSMAEEDVEHVCDKCKASEATMKPEFVKLPEHFIFVIRRYFYNQQNGNKHKLHAKVSMHKYLTFVSSKEVPQAQNIEDQLKIAAADSVETPTPTTTPITSPKKNGRKRSRGGGTKKITISRGIDNRFRDRKMNSSKMGYLVEDINEEELIHKAFENLFKWSKENVHIKAKVKPCTTVNDEPNENFNGFLYALSGGNEALYIKLRDMIWNLLASNADLYASMLSKSEKAFKDYVNKVRKNDLPATNLELHGCAALFEAVIVVNENDQWISYCPKFVKKGNERTVVTSNHPIHRKKLYLPVNVNYIASSLHPKRARSYCLSSVVCHVGQSTEGGHYKCAVQTSTGSWSMCNDDVVSNCQEKTVLDKSGDSGYILFYTLCKDRSPSPKRERNDDAQTQSQSQQPA